MINRQASGRVRLQVAGCRLQVVNRRKGLCRIELAGSLAFLWLEKRRSRGGRTRNHMERTRLNAARASSSRAQRARAQRDTHRNATFPLFLCRHHVFFFHSSRPLFPCPDMVARFTRVRLRHRHRPFSARYRFRASGHRDRSASPVLHPKQASEVDAFHDGYSGRPCDWEPMHSTPTSCFLSLIDILRW